MASADRWRCRGAWETAAAGVATRRQVVVTHGIGSNDEHAGDCTNGGLVRSVLGWVVHGRPGVRWLAANDDFLAWALIRRALASFVDVGNREVNQPEPDPQRELCRSSAPYCIDLSPPTPARLVRSAPCSCASDPDLRVRTTMRAGSTREPRLRVRVPRLPAGTRRFCSWLRAP